MSFNSTLFSKTLALIPRLIFQKLERRHRVGRESRKFGFKEQFVFLAFIQLASLDSMRSAVRNLASIGKKLYHFGLSPFALSTISEANNNRPVEFFQDLFAEMYNLCQSRSPKHKFKFKSKLFSLDASTISLCLSLSPWAKHRKNRGGMKMHTMLDHNGLIPSFVCVTEAKMHDSKIAQQLNLPKNSIVVFDKGYNNYKWFKELGEQNIFFVTRLKTNAKYKVIERKTVNKKLGVTSDLIIEVKFGNEVLRLRKVNYTDATTDKHYEFITNRFDLSAKTIARIYKERWQIELFFKEIKQNLKIKKFVGHSENAVKIQIYTVLTMYLLIAYQKFLSQSKLSVKKIIELVTLHLLETVHLDDLLNPPPERQRKTNNSYQYSLLAFEV